MEVAQFAGAKLVDAMNDVDYLAFRTHSAIGRQL